MLNDKQKQQIIDVINSSLDEAQQHWKNGGHKLIAKAAYTMEGFDSVKAESVPSNIPGHELVYGDKTTIDQFIAFVADMRNSTNHLVCAISPKQADVTELQRVYYETSALLPALALTVKLNGGSVTEYLGDGILALFRVDSEDKKTGIYEAYWAAQDSITITINLVNEALNSRYRLPPLEIGIGLAYSKAMVTLIGLSGEKQAKAFGKCVYRASKLSKGKNKIIVDDDLNMVWPTGKNGPIRFIKKQYGEVNGHIIC